MPDIDIFALPVHPAADIFPMLSDEELDDLAADIKANGLLQPIVVSKVNDEWMLIDGRNRREACRRAKVQPGPDQLVGLNGADPVSYVLSANVHRRHLNAGQKAMAVAMIRPEPAKGGRGQKSPLNGEFSHQYLSRARAVLRHSPELARKVIEGKLSLNDAFADVETRSREDKAKAEAIERVNRDYPDLVRQHAAGEISADQFSRLIASHEADKRKAAEEAANLRRVTFQGFKNALSGARLFAVGDGDADVLRWLADKELVKEFNAYIPDLEALRADAENIRAGAARVLALMDAILSKESK